MTDDRGAQLARLIDDDPDDAEAFRAYGDWLEEQGDPRSQLMALQTLKERLTDRSKLEHLETKLTSYFEEHREAFLGPLVRVVPKASASKKTRDGAIQHFTWKHGFIRTARLARQHQPPIHQIASWLLEHASGRFVVELAIDYPEDPAALLAVLVDRGPRSLRKLVLATNEVDLGTLWPAVPQLRSLVLSYAGELGTIDLPELREARFKRMHLPSAMQAIAEARLPLLETLELELSLEPTLDHVLAILRKDDLPHLRHLALGASFIDELLPEFVVLPLASRLATLDLSESYMLDDTGVAALAPLALDEIRIHPRARVSARGRAQLSAIAKRVVEHDPR